MNKEEIYNRWKPFLDEQNNLSLSSSTIFDGDYSSTIFPLIKRVYATTIGLDLVSVQPMNSPSMGYPYESLEDLRKRKREEREKKIKRIFKDE